MDRWVTTWASAQQAAEPEQDPGLAGVTLRQTIRVCVGGDRLRLRLSNAFGRAPLHIEAAALALPAGGRAGVSGIEPGSARKLTFSGRSSIEIAAGGSATSDPVEFAVDGRSDVTITLVRGDGDVLPTTHPGSRTSSFVSRPKAGGGAAERVAAEALPGAQAIEHWYFIEALEVASSTHAAVVAVLGDSLTDGRGSTTNGNDRWTDQLADRLHLRDRLTHIAVVNQGTGGNRLLRDGLGVSGVARLDRDVLSCAGLQWLIVFEGINDIGVADPTEAAQQRIGDELIAAYDDLIARAHAHGIRVYGATLTPMAGHDYDDPSGLRERTRQRINAWLRSHHKLDAVIDFDGAVRSVTAPSRLDAAYDSGDGLHLSPAGYRALAEAVPAELFVSRRE